MRLQVAIDRTSIAKAAQIIYQLEEYVDIIEIGTSFFKDYGLIALKELRGCTEKTLLADVKTADEAEYEFEQIFQNGGDCATVMGTSAIESIRICQQVAQKYQKEYMIDTLEMSEEKILQLSEFEDGIICLHLPKDKGGDIQEFIQTFMDKYQFKNKVAVAGGVQLKDVAICKKMGIDIVIVGSGITGSQSIGKAAQEFKERM